jgi:hypothetical protein
MFYDENSKICDKKTMKPYTTVLSKAPGKEAFRTFDK